MTQKLIVSQPTKKSPAPNYRHSMKCPNWDCHSIIEWQTGPEGFILIRNAMIVDKITIKCVYCNTDVAVVQAF
jgi:aspartate carbamoyltransferase regulatory subunit